MEGPSRPRPIDTQSNIRRNYDTITTSRRLAIPINGGSNGDIPCDGGRTIGRKSLPVTPGGGIEDNELAYLLMTTNECVAGHIFDKIARGVTYISWIPHYLGATIELEGAMGNFTPTRNDFYIRPDWQIAIPDRPYAMNGRIPDYWRASPLLLGGLSDVISHAPVAFFCERKLVPPPTASDTPS